MTIGHERERNDARRGNVRLRPHEPVVEVGAGCDVLLLLLPVSCGGETAGRQGSSRRFSSGWGLGMTLYQIG